MTTHIRRARPSDLPQIYQMIRALAAFHGDTATIGYAALQEFFFGKSPRAMALVAVSDDNIVGYAGITDVSALHEARARLDIQHLYIQEPHRGRGLGRGSIAAAGDVARQRGAQRLTIGTDPANLAAQAAYRAMGLQEITQRGAKFRVPIQQRNQRITDSRTLEN